MKKATRFIALFAIVLIALAAGTATATQGVSPGALDRLAVVNNPCPTFSWQNDDSTKLYEIVAYSLHSDDDPAAAELTAEAEVLYSRVSAGATSWTPSAEQCFAPGGRYVWFVRPVLDLVDDQIIEAGEWSAGRYFSVPAGPSEADVARAIEVLKQWEAVNRGGSLLLSSGTGTVPDSGSGSGSGTGSGSSHRKSVQTASAAIRGENPESGLEAYGVVGTSASVDGAGVAAANTEGGPDLVLDGSYDGVPGAELSEWGLNRPGPTDQTFTFRNTDAGRLHVAVTGDISGHTVDMQELKISGSTVIDDTGEWLGSGNMLPCVDCVTSAEIAADAVGGGEIEDGGVGSTDIDGGAVVTGHLADDAVTGAKIADGGVATVDLADNSVTGAKIANGSIGSPDIHGNVVNSSHIVDGTVDSADLADGSVTQPKIATGAVSAAAIRNNAVANNHLADDAVTSAKILDGSVTTDDIMDSTVSYRDLASGSVRSGQIFDGSVGSSDLADGAVLTAKIGDFSITGTKIGPSAITGTHIAEGAVHATDVAPSSITTGHIVDGTIAAADVAASSITGSHIVNGTITAADVESTGGLYSSRWELYEKETSQPIDPGESVWVLVRCDEYGDLPLQGFCPSYSDEVVLTAFWVDHWYPDGDPHHPGFYCGFRNNGSTSQTVQAGIVCVDTQ